MVYDERLRVVEMPDGKSVLAFGHLVRDLDGPSRLAASLVRDRPGERDRAQSGGQRQTTVVIDAEPVDALDTQLDRVGIGTRIHDEDLLDVAAAGAQENLDARVGLAEAHLVVGGQPAPPGGGIRSDETADPGGRALDARRLYAPRGNQALSKSPAAGRLAGSARGQ
jgi:hypothetical protein